MKNNTTTKHSLINSLFLGHPLVDELGNKVFTNINSVAIESGSRKTFNVVAYNEKGEKVTFFVETID